MGLLCRGRIITAVLLTYALWVAADCIHPLGVSQMFGFSEIKAAEYAAKGKSPTSHTV